MAKDKTHPTTDTIKVGSVTHHPSTVEILEAEKAQQERENAAYTKRVEREIAADEAKTDAHKGIEA